VAGDCWVGYLNSVVVTVLSVVVERPQTRLFIELIMSAVRVPPLASMYLAAETPRPLVS